MLHSAPPHPLPPASCTAEGVGMTATDWPRGCLGYACNLVRPLHRGHRALLLSNLLGGALVFERLEEAEEYREFLSTVGGAGGGGWVTRGRQRGLCCRWAWCRRWCTCHAAVAAPMARHD